MKNRILVLIFNSLFIGGFILALMNKEIIMILLIGFILFISIPCGIMIWNSHLSFVERYELDFSQEVAPYTFKRKKIKKRK